jgi:hypothetical protein
MNRIFLALALLGPGTCGIPESAASGIETLPLEEQDPTQWEGAIGRAMGESLGEAELDELEDYNRIYLCEDEECDL